MSNDNLNLKSQFATLKKWDSLRSQNVTIEGRCGQHIMYLPYAFSKQEGCTQNNTPEFVGIRNKTGLKRFVLSEMPIAKQAAAQFETKIRQQAVAQLTQIPWGHD